MTDSDRARMVGINHVAIAVDDAEAAEQFYGDLFEFDVRGRTDHSVFLDMGDQFLAISETDDAGEATDDHRHVGLVVDDATAVERALDEHGVDRLPGRGLDFRDPWGNRVQVVQYGEIQFTKADHVLAGMGVDGTKTDDAIAELAEKGMAPDEDS